MVYIFGFLVKTFVYIDIHKEFYVRFLLYKDKGGICVSSNII